MCAYLQKSPANSLRTVTANHAKYTKRIRVFRVVRGQKNLSSKLNMRSPPNAKVSDGSQTPMTLDLSPELNGWLRSFVL